MYRFCANRFAASVVQSGQTGQPSRQPVMPNVLEKLLMTKMSLEQASAVDGSRS